MAGVPWGRVAVTSMGHKQGRAAFSEFDGGALKATRRLSDTQSDDRGGAPARRVRSSPRGDPAPGGRRRGMARAGVPISEVMRDDVAEGGTSGGRRGGFRPPLARYSTARSISSRRFRAARPASGRVGQVAHHDEMAGSRCDQVWDSLRCHTARHEDGNTGPFDGQTDVADAGARPAPASSASLGPARPRGR